MDKKLAIEGGHPVRKQPMPFDPKLGLPSIGNEEINAVVEVLKSGKLSQLVGTRTKAFESEFARYHQAKHAVAVSNGTTALHVALASIGIGPGDEVIVPSLTFLATATAVLHQNAIPVFADVDPHTYTMDPEDLEDKITPFTKAIIVVHLFGQPADLDRIIKIVEEHSLTLIEDCAQSPGAEYKGRKVGTFGHMSSYSFYQTKNITTGEGGMVLTNNDTFADRAKMIRHHGEMESDIRSYRHEILGYNYRMTEVQAAIGLVQLKKLDTLNEHRIRNSHHISEHLNETGGIVRPIVRENTKHVFYTYPIRFEQEKLGVSRDWFLRAMIAEGIPVCSVSMALNLQPIFVNLSGYGNTSCPFLCPLYKGRVKYGEGVSPTAEKASRELVLFPMSPKMTEEDLNDVVKATRKVMNRLELDQSFQEGN